MAAPVNVIQPTDPRQAFLESQKAKDAVMKDMMSTLQMNQQIRAQQQQLTALKKQNDYSAWWSMMTETAKNSAGGLAGMIGTQPGLFKYGFLNYLNMTPDQADIAVENLRSGLLLNPTAQAEMMYSKMMSDPEYAASLLNQAPTVQPGSGSSSPDSTGVPGATAPESPYPASQPAVVPDTTTKSVTTETPGKPYDSLAAVLVQSQKQAGYIPDKIGRMTQGKNFLPGTQSVLDIIDQLTGPDKMQAYQALLSITTAANAKSEYERKIANGIFAGQIGKIAVKNPELAQKMGDMILAETDLAQNPKNAPGTKTTSQQEVKNVSTEQVKTISDYNKAPSTPVEAVAQATVGSIGERAQKTFLDMLALGENPAITQAGIVLNNSSTINFAAGGNQAAINKIKKDGVKAVEDLGIVVGALQGGSDNPQSGPEYRRTQRMLELAAAKQYQSTFEVTGQHLMNIFQRTNIADAMGDLQALATAGGQGLQERKQLEATLKQINANMAVQFANLGIEGFKADTERTYQMGMLSLAQWNAQLQSQSTGIFADPGVKYILNKVDTTLADFAKVAGNNMGKYNNLVNNWYNANKQNQALYDAYLSIMGPAIGATGKENIDYKMSGIGRGIRQFVSLFGFLNGTGWIKQLSQTYPGLSNAGGVMSADDLAKSLNNPEMTALMKQIMARYPDALAGMNQ